MRKLVPARTEIFCDGCSRQIDEQDITGQLTLTRIFPHRKKTYDLCEDCVSHAEQIIAYHMKLIKD